LSEQDTKPKPTREERLAALRLYGTRYEAVVKRRDGEIRLLGYLGRHSQDGLMAALREQGREIIAFLDLGRHDQEMTRKRGAKPRHTITFSKGRHEAYFTGRTERDAISGDELPHISA
jgi:hypothetical protein